MSLRGSRVRGRERARGYSGSGRPYRVRRAGAGWWLPAVAAIGLGALLGLAVLAVGPVAALAG
ncbi:MAG TPA: hypothetical protein VLC95_04560, partial [Anaerolineae bacterium]|nr:hypothetical protein [Anaerolineae bacterium]